MWCEALNEFCTHERLTSRGERQRMCQDCREVFNVETSPVDVNDHGFQCHFKNFKKRWGNDLDINTDEITLLKVYQESKIDYEIRRKSQEEIKAKIKSLECKHTNALKLPYSGELCLQCNVILINDDFDKHLTKQSYNAIMRVLAENYDGDVKKNPKWYYTYKFVNVNEKAREERASRASPVCRHPKKNEDNGTFFCTTCGEVLDQVSQSRRDLDYLDYISLKPVQNKEDAFQNTIDEFQGKYVNDVPQKVYDDLSTILTKGDVISKRDVKNALKKLKLSKYYKGVHYIHHILTGISKNDISEYEQRLNNDFDYILKVYNKRLNKQLVLYVLLESYGCTYDRSEFSIPKSVKDNEARLVKLIPTS